MSRRYGPANCHSTATMPAVIIVTRTQPGTSPRSSRNLAFARVRRRRACIDVLIGMFSPHDVGPIAIDRVDPDGSWHDRADLDQPGVEGEQDRDGQHEKDHRHAESQALPVRNTAVPVRRSKRPPGPRPLHRRDCRTAPADRPALMVYAHALGEVAVCDADGT